MTTFLAPASRCFCAPSRFVKKPVDSITRSISRSRQGSTAGSRSASPRTSRPPIVNEPPSTSTSSGNVPSTEAWRSRCAIVFTSPRSLNATISKSPPRSSAARKKLRPIRPNPLIPTRVFAMSAMLDEPLLRGCGDAVDLGELAAQVAHVRLGVDLGRADDAVERLAGRELPAEAVKMLAQPVAQRAELTLLEPVVQVGDVRRDPLPDLRRDQVAERVRREVADRAARPVDVLQDALGVVRHVDPEVVVH